MKVESNQHPPQIKNHPRLILPRRELIVHTGHVLCPSLGVSQSVDSFCNLQITITMHCHILEGHFGDSYLSNSEHIVHAWSHSWYQETAVNRTRENPSMMELSFSKGDRVSEKEVFHRIEQVVRRRILREMKGDICGLVFATEGPGHDSLR
jgi:hypothetical protein